MSWAGWCSMHSRPMSMEKTTTWVRLNLSSQGLLKQNSSQKHKGKRNHPTHLSQKERPLKSFTTRLAGVFSSSQTCFTCFTILGRMDGNHYAVPISQFLSFQLILFFRKWKQPGGRSHLGILRVFLPCQE